ncbi:MAG: hypothetical protein AAGA12_05920 [Pseudomonadota bacterium]
MEDEFAEYGPGLTSPAGAAEAITPNDGADIAFATRGLYAGQGGDLNVTLVSGDQVVLINIQPGIIYPLRVKRVSATGTTAADIVGLR